MRHDGQLFHIQTETKDVKGVIVITTQLFLAGKILDTQKVELSNLSPEEKTQQALTQRAKSLHVQVLKKLVTGKIDAVKKVKKVHVFAGTSLLDAIEARVVDEYDERPVIDIGKELEENAFEKRIEKFLDSISEELL
ncbi:MAG: hypothetical protein KDD52_10075 [Bdellovibrionales bacterium]|nr:hypothetical protein [Bdellovibrionales bacterium]